MEAHKRITVLRHCSTKNFLRLIEAGIRPVCERRAYMGYYTCVPCFTRYQGERSHSNLPSERGIISWIVSHRLGKRVAFLLSYYG